MIGLRLDCHIIGQYLETGKIPSNIVFKYPKWRKYGRKYWETFTIVVFFYEKAAKEVTLSFIACVCLFIPTIFLICFTLTKNSEQSQRQNLSTSLDVDISSRIDSFSGCFLLECFERSQKNKILRIFINSTIWWWKENKSHFWTVPIW